MSSDSHSDDHAHDSHGHSNDSHDSHGHAPAADVIPESSWQDWVLKGLTICAAGLLYYMAFSWMGVPLPEAGHEASEHGQQHGTSEQAAPEHNESHH